jgi:hypothetical protein
MIRISNDHHHEPTAADFLDRLHRNARRRSAVCHAALWLLALAVATIATALILPRALCP